jgi:hypothetical protein
VGNVSSAAGAWTVSATSSNQALVSNDNLVVTGSGTNLNLTITPTTNQWGTATITVTVTDGYGGRVTRTFALTVNFVYQPPSLAPIDDQTMPASQGTLVLGLSATDPEGEPITFSVNVQSLAYVLNQQLGLTFAGDYYQNSAGLNEKWLLGGDGVTWYYILPSGELFDQNGTFWGLVGASYWAGPSLLYNAQPDQPHATASVAADGTLTLTLDSGFVGSVFLTVVADDGQGSDTKWFTVNVTNS